MAIPKYTVWLAQDGGPYSTQYNLVLLANAVDIPVGTFSTGEYNDTAQRKGSSVYKFNTSTTPDGLVTYTYSDACTIALTGETANLEIGGDYSSNEDPANVRFSQTGYVGACRSASAVYFSQNGIFHLTAQNGARTVDVDSGFSDDDILLVMSGTLGTGNFEYEGEKEKTHYTYCSGENLYLAVVRAAESLEVSSDMVGSFIVDQAMLTGGYRESGTSAGIYGVQAHKLTFDGNYRANTTIQNSKLAVYDTTEYSLANSYLHLAGISSETDFTSRGEWVNTVAVTGNSIDVALDGANHYFDTSDIDPFENPVIQNSVATIAAVEVARESGTTLSINAIGFAGGAGAWADYASTMTVTGNDVTLWAYGEDDTYLNQTSAAPTATITGNTASTAVLTANTITLGDVAANAAFSAIGGTTTLRAEISNGRVFVGETQEKTGGEAKIKDNVVSVTGLCADVIAVNAFAGTISVAGGSLNAVAWNQNCNEAGHSGQTDGYWSWTFGDEALVAAGIFAADRMTVSAYFGGDIVVTRGTASGMVGETVAGEIAGKAVGELLDAFTPSGTVSGGTFFGSLDNCTIVGKITDGTVESWNTWAGTFGGTITDAVPIGSGYLTIVGGTVISEEGVVITEGAVEGGTICGGTVVDGEISGTAAEGQVGLITKTDLPVVSYACGILTPYLMDKGRIAVNISSGDDNLLDACIKAGKIESASIVGGGTVCTDAITGVLTGAVIGIDVLDAFVSPYYVTSVASAEADSIDVTGFIGGDGMKYALKVGASTATSIRVSGTIAVDENNFAIAAQYGGSDEALDDVVEIAANAVVAKENLLEAVETIAEGGRVYASADDGLILIENGDAIGTITGGTVTGKILLSLSAATNWAIINTRSTLGSADEKFHFIGNEGLLNLSFQLDGKAQDKAVYLTDFDDASMTSTTTIGINCDYAKSGDVYQLIQYDENITTKWEKRKITFVWRGEELVAAFDPAANNSVTVTFSDGTTATLEMVSNGTTSTLQATVVKSASASQLVTLDTYRVTEKWNAAKNTYVIDWSACNWADTMAKFDYYEIEYSINGENTIVTRLDKDQTSLTINQVLSGDVILWRIRGVDINLYNAGYYANETLWSDYLGQACVQSEALPSIDMSASFADASGQYTKDGAKVNGAAALVYWDPAVATNTTVDHYVIEYVESLDRKTVDEAKAMLDGGTTTSVKQTTDTSVMLSSLTTRCYVYWRVKAVDVYGNESDYKMGEEFRVFDGDSTAPVFTDSKVNVSYTRGTTSDKVNITVGWSYATDSGSGVKYYKVTLTDENGISQSQTCNFSGDHAYALAFNDIAKGNYTVTVTVSDYSKNYATIQSEPATPPTLDADAFTVNYVKVDASYINFKVAWDQAVSASGIAIDSYVVTLWQNGVNKASQTVTDDGSSHYTATFDNQIFETGEYTVTIQAYDLAQNASEQLSQYRICGAIDLNGDWGTITKQPTITVEYEEEWIEKAGGHTYFDTKTGQIVTGGTVCVKNVTSASAVFTWEDTFSNERGVYYALDFSNTDDFSGTVYTYYTESSDVVYEAGTRTVTLDQDATRPISLLAAISGGTLNQKVYWRLRAGGMDDDGFVSTSVSGVNSFYFDYDDGTPICHNVSPAVATVEVAQTQGGTGTSARAYDGKLAVTITTEQTDLGIAKYEVYFVNMSNSSYSYTWTADYNSDLIAADDGYNTFTKVFDLTQIFGNVYYDGTYAMVVNTYNAAGEVTSNDCQVIVNGSTVTGFVVDTVAPLKVEDVTLLTFANGVLVSWDASADAYGIAKYVIKGKVSGSSIWQDMLTVDGTTTSAMISGFSDNTYQFAVCAVDNNGNVSEYSEQPSINVYTETDYEDNYLPDKWVTFSTTDFSVSNSIGSADKADYFCIACDVSCLLSVDLSALVNMSGNSLGITIGLYKYDGSGNEQAIQLFSVTQDQQLLTNYVLEAGEYFVKVTANNASAIDVYALNFSKSNFSTAAYNNKSDNNWMTLDENTFTAISTENSLTDWVGYGDDIDYRRVDFTESGNYSFNLSTTDDPATLVLYEQVGATLTAIKSISTSAASNFTTMTALLDNQKTYYIGVTASGNALLKNSNYLASVTLNYAYNDSTVKYACHADDTAALATVNCAALSMDNAVIRDWVGFSDSIDFRRIYLEHGGNYNLRLSGVTHAMRFTLYQETNGVLTTLQSITIDPAEGRSATGKIGNVWLDASANATYYVSMEALNAADEKNSNYLLNLSAYTVYSEGAHNDDDTAALAAAQEKYHLAINGSVTNEWVGFGDTIDYRKIDLACSGAYCFTLSGIVNATQLALWRKVDGELVLVNQLIVNEGTEALWQQLDQANEYYISVACVNPDAAHNSYYAMTMTGTEFPRAQHGDDWSDLATMGSASSEYGSFGTITEANKGLALTRWDDVTGEIGQQINWVSFGDKVDYVAFTLNSAAKLVFNLTSVNTVNAKLSINALNAGSAGYTLTELGSAITYASTSGTEVWLTQGTYYIAVEALNADAGGNGNYAVSLGADSVFYLKSNVGNTNSTWQDAARYQSEPYESATTLTDWIGFGNAADYWKVQMTQDGKLQIALTGEAWTAYQAGDVELELIDGNERSVDLIQSGNVFTSELEFAKGNVCYFGISCTDKTGMSFQTDYTAKLSVLAIK